MSEIRCPMCGKPNPDELEVCQFCEARLKPLRIQPPQNGAGDKLPEWSEPDQNGEQDTEDRLSKGDVEDSQEWLDRIRFDSEIEDETHQEIEPESPPDDDSAADTDEDWLQRVRSLQEDDQTDETEPDGSLLEPHSDATPDDDTLIADGYDSSEWLERLQDLKGPDDDTPSVEVTESVTPEDSEPTFKGELPDWIPTPPSEEPEAEAAIPEQVEDTPDWLSGLGAEDEAVAPEEDEPTLEGELPDWLPVPPSEEPKAEAAIPEQAEETPDWLSGLGAEDEAATPEEDEPALEGELPDWLPAPPLEEPEAEAAISEQAEDTPDWVSGIGAEDEAVAPEEDEPALEGELPDWLPTPPSEEPEAEVAIPEQVEDTPDWLSGIGVEDEAVALEDAEPALEGELPDWIPTPPSEEPEPEGEPTIPEQVEETPDWLSELGIEDEAATPEDAEPALEGELPDWLPTPPSEEPEAEAAIPEQVEDTPDWLSGIGVEDEAVALEDAEPALEGELPDWLPAPSSEEPEAEAAIPEQEAETPDWLSGLGIEGEAVAPEDAEPALEGELPDWLPAPSSEEPEVEVAIPEQEAETPDWLSGLGIEGEAVAPEDSEPTFEGELPDWLPAPPSEEPEIEAAVPEEAEPAIEGELSAWIPSSTSEEPEAEAAIPEQEAETPDWLSGLGIEGEAVAPEDAEPALEGELPDWLPAPPSEEPEIEAAVPEEAEPAIEGELPAWIPSSTSEEPEAEAAIPEQVEDTPDWLSELGIEDETAEPEDAEPALEGELPDWIPTPPSEEPEGEPTIPEQVEETPDWLSELGIEDEAVAPEDAGPALEGELPDWIPSSTSEEPEAEAAIPEQVEETPDWLSELGIEDETAEPEDAGPVLEGELPDWLPVPPSEEPKAEAATPEEAEPAIEGELPDWIPVPPSEEPEAEAAIPEQEEGTPDWLSELGIEDEAVAPEEAEPVLEGELPDRIPVPPSEEPEAEPAIPEQVEDTPDWLSDKAATPEDAEPVLEGELPDWMTETPQEEFEAGPAVSEQKEDAPDRLSDKAATPEDIEPAIEDEIPVRMTEIPQEELEAEPIVSEQGEDAPDWLLELGIEYEAATSEDAEPAIDGEIPDWLTEAPDEEPAAEPVIPGQEQEIPDWLSDQDESSRIPASEEGSEPEWAAETGDVGIFATQVPQRPGEHVPDWLSDGDEGVEPATTEDEDLQSWFSELDKEPELSGEPETKSRVSDTGEDMPGWLKNLGSVVTGTIEDDDVPDEKDGGVSPFVDQEAFDDDLLDVESLPKWLSPETELPDDVEEIEDDSGLSPVELPGWLAAMRPVDVKKPKVPIDEGLVESAGPLAGLQSVLPAEVEITRFTKPPVYSAKLKVTRSQQEHANLFHKMLSVEGELEPLPPTPLISSQRVLRWAIAFILMIAIGFFVIGGREYIPLPGNTAIPDATYASSKIISSIPDKAPVLLAFDYQPGIAGEMHAAAAGLVDHLMLKGARLSLVSTLPTGPALAEYFIQTVQSQHGYTKGVQYVNLGYIPGGAAGLLSFAQTPKWVFPLSYNGFSPWETQPLRGVDSLSDFVLIVVITEDPEDARTWIEQVQPRIGDTPMLTVLSAQAEPLVRPYYGNDQYAQVKGIVSGLSGGAAYEMTVGRANYGRTYWDAFSVGLLIALGAILIGGLVNVIQLLIPRKNNDSRGNSS